MFITKKHISRRSSSEGRRSDAWRCRSWMPWCLPARLLPKPPRLPSCGRASSIFLTARSWATRRMVRPWTSGRPAAPAPISSSARSSPRWSRTRSTFRLSGIWRTPPPRVRFIRSLPPRGSAPPVRIPARPRAHMATTLDQVIAKIIGQDTPLPSLEVASETTVQSAAGSGGSYSTLSFRDAESPLPMEPNPRKVFLQLFGEGDTPQERASISTRRPTACWI